MHPILLLSVPFVLFSFSGPAAPVEWEVSLATAKAKAQSINKPILVYCWADGSDYCGKLWQETLSQGEAAAPLGQFVCYSARHGADGVQAIFEQHAVRTLPTLLFLSPKGEAEDLIQGFIPIGDFAGELARIRSGEGTVSGLQRQIDESADGSDADIEARYALAGKVQALGQEDRHDGLMNSIKVADPKGKTLIGARLKLNELTKAIVWQGYEGEEGDEGQHEEETEDQRLERSRKWDLSTLHAHVKSVPLAEARHEAWQQIGDLEVQRRNMQAAFEAFHQAWKTCPEERVVDWSNDVARWIVKNQADRTSKEKKFALQLAESAVKTLHKRIAKEQPQGAELDGWRDYEAYCWNTVAWCQHINGRKNDAVKAAKKAIAIKAKDQYTADLEKFSKG